jgi:mycoredoxin
MAGRQDIPDPEAKEMVRKVVVNALIVAVCLAAGLWLGPLARAGYERAFPPPLFVTGDYSTMYRQADAPVVMYSTSTCPHCADARRLLAQLGVSYRDFVIDQDADAKRRYEALNGDGVPLLFIGDRRILGFRENVIRESLQRGHVRAGTRKQ